MDDTLDFWNLYAEEGGSSLEDMERILGALRACAGESPEQKSLVAAFFRAIHTFKGGARSMGFSVIESRAHLGEDLIGQVRDDGVPFAIELHDLLLELVDTLWGMLHESIGQKADVDPRPTMHLMERMEKMRDSARDAPAESVTELPVDESPSENEAKITPDGALSEDLGIDEVQATSTDEALIFDPVDPMQLADDPVYQEIFADMVCQAVLQMQAIAISQGVANASADIISAEADKMIHAAQRLGFQEWIDRLEMVNDVIAAGEKSFELWLDGLTKFYAECFPAAPSISLAPFVNPKDPEPEAHEWPFEGDVPIHEHGERGGSDLAARMMTAMGELVTSQATNRYLLERIRNEDIVRKIELILVEHGLPLTSIQYPLRQYLGGWQEKIEELLQIDLHAQSLIEQLQDVVMDEQVKSSGLLVDALQEQMDLLQSESGSAMRMEFLVGINEQVDTSTLEQLIRIMNAIVDVCVRQRVFHVQTGPFFKFELEKSEDGVSVHTMVTNCELPQETSAIFDQMADGIRERGGRIVCSIDPDTAKVGIDLHLPLTMSVMDGMVLRVGRIDYVVPIAAIQRIVLPDASAVVQVSAYGAAHRVLRLDDDQVMSIRHLCPGASSPVALNQENVSSGKQIFVVLGKAGMQSVAIPVDELLGQQQVLIRPLLGFLALMEGVVGCTLLGSGQVGMVLNINHLLARRKHAA